jgi:hypothetical protein
VDAEESGDVGRGLSARQDHVNDLAALGGGKLRAPSAMPPLGPVHIFIDFGQLCSSKPTGRVHGNRTAVFMISTTCFQAGQHPS